MMQWLFGTLFAQGVLFDVIECLIILCMNLSVLVLSNTTIHYPITFASTRFDNQKLRLVLFHQLKPAKM